MESSVCCSSNCNFDQAIVLRRPIPTCYTLARSRHTHPWPSPPALLAAAPPPSPSPTPRAPPPSGAPHLCQSALLLPLHLLRAVLGVGRVGSL